MKEYKGRLIITSIVTLLPMVIGILLWNRLPDTMATHFGTGNVPNGWSSKPFVVFGLPGLLLVLHLFSILMTLNDPKKKNIGKKMLAFLFWIVPVVSLIVAVSVYGYALNIAMDIGLFANLLVGVVFIVSGNYMSKNRQNYTVGIKVPWTLNSQENWNRTHRMASKLWMAVGLFMVVNAFLQWEGVMLAVIVVSSVFPITYSFILYKKGI